MHRPTRLADIKNTVSNMSRMWSNGKPGTWRACNHFWNNLASDSEVPAHRPTLLLPVKHKPVSTAPEHTEMDSAATGAKPERTWRTSQADVEMNYAHSYEACSSSPQFSSCLPVTYSPQKKPKTLCFVQPQLGDKPEFYSLLGWPSVGCPPAYVRHHECVCELTWT